MFFTVCDRGLVAGLRCSVAVTDVATEMATMPRPASDSCGNVPPLTMSSRRNVAFDAGRERGVKSTLSPVRPSRRSRTVASARAAAGADRGGEGCCAATGSPQVEARSDVAQVADGRHHHAPSCRRAATRRHRRHTVISVLLPAVQVSVETVSGVPPRRRYHRERECGSRMSLALAAAGAAPHADRGGRDRERHANVQLVPPPQPLKVNQPPPPAIVAVVTPSRPLVAAPLLATVMSVRSRSRY
jgi:hypothetical protein